MNRILVPCLLFAALFSVLGCKKDRLLTNSADLIYRESLEIPAGIGVFDVSHYYLKDIPTQYKEILDRANIKPADVLQVLTAQGSLRGIFGDANLDFVDRVSVRAFRGNDPNDFLEIAYRDPSPVDPGNTIGLIPSLANSKEFLSEESFNIDVVIWLRRTTTETVQLQLDLLMQAGY